MSKRGKTAPAVCVACVLLAFLIALPTLPVLKAEYRNTAQKSENPSEIRNASPPLSPLPPLPQWAPPHLEVYKSVASMDIWQNGTGLSPETANVTMTVKADGNTTIQKRGLDVVMVVDNSWTMSQPMSRWNNTVAAATNFINNMTKFDRCAIFAFLDMLEGYPLFVTDGMGENGFVRTDISGQNDIINVLATLYPPTAPTPLWDTIGAAYNFAIQNPSQRMPVVIAMTDGNDDITISPNDDETASRTYCPGAPSLAVADRTWATHPPADGCYWGGIHGHYQNIQRCRVSSNPNLDTFSWINTWRKGLVQSPILTYTIGLQPDPQGNNSGDSGYLAPSDPNYKYTTEFDLKQIAQTTSNSNLTGKYYYVNDPAKLTDVYSEIYTLISNTTGEAPIAIAPSSTEPMVKEVLPPYMTFCGWKTTPNCTVNPYDFKTKNGANGTLELWWGVSSFGANDTFEVCYTIKSDLPGWQSVGVNITNATGVYGSDYCRVKYMDHLGNIWTNETPDLSIYVMKNPFVPEFSFVFVPAGALVAVAAWAPRRMKA